MTKFSILLNILIFLASNLFAQELLSFETVLDENGDVIHEVTGVFQDKTGFLWFGSSNGLYRYDGKRTTVFRHDVKNSFSIPSSGIWQIVEDSRQRLWVSTQNGLAMLDSARTKFTRVFPDGSNAEHLRRPYTNAICIDHHGLVWFTSVLGLHQYNPETHATEIFPIHDFTPYIPPHRATGKIIEKDNHLWIATITGLCRFDVKTKTWKYFLAPVESKEQLELHNTLQDIYVASDSVLWIGYWGGGIKKFNLQTEKFQTWLYNNNVPRQYWGWHNIVRNVVPANDSKHKKFWLAVLDRTLAEFDTESGTFNFIDETNSQGFDGKPVIGCWNTAGHLWVATYDKLYKLNLNATNFTQVNLRQLSTDVNAVNGSLVSTSDGKNLYGEFGRELFRISNGKAAEKIPFKKNGKVIFVQLLDDNALLIECENDDHYLYNISTGKARSFTPEHKSIENIAVGKKGVHLIASVTDGAWQWDENNGSWAPLSTRSGESLAKKYPYLYNVHVGSDNKVWLATHHNGLVCYDPVTDSTKVFTTTPDGQSLAIFYDIDEDENHNIWAANSDGLICVTNGKISRHFTSSDGLPSDAVFKILIDKNNLWMTTQRGLVQLDLATNKTFTFGQQQGLEHYNLMHQPIALLDQGRIAVSQESKILILNLASQQSQTIPKTVITSLRVVGKKYDPVNQLHLTHEQNQLAFEFATLDYNMSQLNQYTYMLEGADKSWNFSGTNATANYAGLSPGTYTFHVKGANAAGVWSEVTSMSFIIETPFWQTLWFKSAIAAMIVLIVYILYRYRVAQIIRLQRIRNDIASDLHDDIGSALTSISLFSEAAKKHALPEGKPIIDNMGITSRKVLEDMNDIVWAISPKNDPFKNVFDRMRLFGNQLMEQAQIDFSISAEDDLISSRMSMTHRRNLFLIYKEALHNVVKYASATKVEVEIKSAAKGIIIDIRDNGKGFDITNTNSGNGLDNMQLRARQMNGVVTIQSEPGNGTTVRVYFKATAIGRENIGVS